MNPYKIVNDFEESVANYAGSRYAIAVDSCTNAIFLCAKYLNVEEVTIPSRTYPSVPCSILHAGGKIKFINLDWKTKKYYQLSPYLIYDAAHLFCHDMYNTVSSTSQSAFVCISFSSTKFINIGKGGMILTNDEKATSWFKQARYCGRHELPLMEDNFEVLGWNMYMTPEQAARGLLLMNNSRSVRNNDGDLPDYPDLSKFKVYQTSPNCYI